ncbi:MAG: iron ABC transporter permease [Deltaproteobacteria bacterium]|nr:iron ABC transporter permease [Deltaproteobacteria bacterium]MBF0524822.1 iron ABC transporter permease [Deltaproteobacteria bacterium]
MLIDPSAGPEQSGYERLTRRRTLVLLFAVFLFSTVAILSLGVGSYQLSPAAILKALCGLGDEGIVRHLVWSIRLPRTMGAILAGAGLGVSGIVMQTLLKNPLAAPSTLGVSQGAAFGAAFAIIMLGAGQTHVSGNEAVTLTSRSTVVISAFTGSLITVIVIFALSTIKRISAESMILAGVAMSAFLSACTMLLQYFASDVQVAATVFWTFGDLGKAGPPENVIMAVTLVPAFLYFMLKSWSYNALQWGDDVAKSLGVGVKSLRLAGLVITCLIVSVATSFLGIIGFIGLLAPHLMRLVVGNDQRFLIPASALAGGLLLLCSDIFSRTVLAPVILPVGIITSFAGAPLFLYLLLTRRSR